MPRSTSTLPATSKEAAKLTDEFYGVWNWNYSIQNERPSQRIFKPPQEIPLSTIPQDSTSNNKPVTTPSQTQSIVPTKKKVDPKYFDYEKGAQCFICQEWGHKAKYCSKEVGAVATSKQQKVEDSWNTLEGRLGSHQCTVLLDTGADTSVVAADLVSETTLTREYFRIAGVHSVDKELPLARLMIDIKHRRVRMRAAVVEQPPQDVLMGRNCPELKELLKEALVIKQDVTVVTRQQTKHEQEKKKLYQMSNTACEEEDFTFPPEYDPMERITVKNKTNKSRRQKHKDRLQVFSHSYQL